MLGSRYENSPIIVDDGSTPPAEHHANFQPSAHPGCLAPHAWLDDGTSLYDHFGLGYSLLLLDDSGAARRDRIRSAAEAAGVPLKMLDLRRTDLAELYEAPLALIRPDQFVAWRGSDADAEMIIDTVRGVEGGNSAEGVIMRAGGTINVTRLIDEGPSADLQVPQSFCARWWPF